MGLFKKSNIEKIKEYFNKGFKKEIRELEACRNVIDVREKDYKKSRDLDWKTEFDKARQTVSDNELKALSFLETYDFLRRPDTDAMRQIAESSHEAVARLDAYTEADTGSAGTAAGGASTGVPTENDTSYLTKAARRFHAESTQIADADMKNRLTEIESLLVKINEKAAENSTGKSSHGNFDKLETYYLPTLEKLFETYDSVQGKQGENLSNIETIQKETADAADTVIEVLKTLYNDAYGDTAWDVSTESSVLKKVAERDGLLANNDFQEK